MLYPIIIVGSVVTGYFYGNYFTNFASIVSDKICGYHTIKCSNNSCNKSYKILNSEVIDMTKKFYCNTVCEYIAHNTNIENYIKMHKYVC